MIKEMFCTKKMGLKSVFAIVLLFVILTSALGVVSANSVITVNVGQTVYVNHGSPWLELPGFNGLKWTDLMYDTTSMSCWVGEGIIGISGRRPTNGQAKYVDFSWCCQVYYGPGRYEDYTGSGYVYVIVTDNNPPSGITLPSTASISYNGSTTLDAVLKPANAMSFLTWSSSNTNVATVSPQGVVKAVKPGTATITVSTHNGLTARCNLTVTPPKPVVNSVSPKSGETGVSCDSVIKCVFSSTVYKSTKFSSVSVVDKTTNKAVPFTPELTGSGLVLKPSSRLTPGHSYSVKIPAGAIENSYDVPLQKDYEWTFRAENLELLTKKAGEGGYADIGDKATFGFSTSVSKGSQWNNITFEDTKQNKSVDFTARISGKEIIITPGSELDYYTDYKVTLPAGSLKNPVGGELENDIVLSFTTKDVKPEVISYTPDDDPDRTDVDTSVFLYFNTEVFKSDNFDKIRFCNAITGEEVPCEISCSSRYVSYHAEDDLSPITDYLFHMPENAIANITGDGNDAFTLRFTTMAPDDPEFSGVSASISIENDLFGNDDILELFATEGADIYYTLDGTDPRSFGELYTKPVDLPDTFKTIIRAVAVKDGALSEVVQRIFTNGELAGETVFADNYGVKGEYTEYRDMIQTDGGYILVGDNVIEKRDFDGSVLWRTTYEDYYFTGVTEVSDGYIAVSDDENTYCSKIDKNGNALWTKNGGSFWAAAVTGDNGDCVAVGGNGIRKINKDGDVIWSSSAGSEVYLRDIVSVDDGYVACGNSGDDAILVKFDKSGTRMWFRTFDSYGDECFWGTEKTKDGFVVVGHCDNFGRGDFEGTDNGEALLVWVDNDGNLTGSASYNADGFMDITATDSGFAIAGNEYFFEIDKNGGIIFKNKLNGAYMECIIKSGRTCVMAGGAYGRSFGDYELENLTAIGSKDGVFFIFKDNISNFITIALTEQNNITTQQTMQYVPNVEQSKQDFINNTQALTPQKNDEKN